MRLKLIANDGGRVTPRSTILLPSQLDVMIGEPPCQSFSVAGKPTHAPLAAWIVGFACAVKGERRSNITF
jgi:site-specific DNA-cytosine methylase